MGCMISQTIFIKKGDCGHVSILTCSKKSFEQMGFECAICILKFMMLSVGGG